MHKNNMSNPLLPLPYIQKESRLEKNKSIPPMPFKNLTFYKKLTLLKQRLSYIEM